ncbi:MAG TPA: acetolactate synthase small subunit [Chloroflexia bacterium]|nr:acetolactate synthase small subunit [Chloroflexia bacterium]
MPATAAKTEHLHTIVVQLEDEPGALNRVVNLFRRRGYNIESLSVGHTEEPNISRMTLAVRGEDEIVEQLTKQLYKLLEIIKVTDVTEDSTIIREMAIIKVNADKPESRAEIMQFSEIFKARVLDVAADSITVEITGPEEEVERFFALLRRYGIKESVRTGRVAMARGSVNNSAI